tara:strand:+ start:1562 stop:3334 length:1773 start_codon:yes stop_codon:yes gene_type:complete
MSKKIALNDLPFDHQLDYVAYDLQPLLSSPKGKALKIKGKTLGSDQALFSISSTKDQDLYIELKRLDQDLDFKVYGEPEYNETLARKGQVDLPFLTGSRLGVEPENGFFQIKAGKKYILKISNQTQPVGEKVNHFVLDLGNFKSGKNSNIMLPDDPDFNKQWYLFNGGFQSVDHAMKSILNFDIAAPEAWRVRASAKGVPVAVIDSGIDYQHPDLKANLWTNKGEIPGNNEDDDENGYKDDVHGWDWGKGADTGLDFSGHGTHVAGTIGAQGNNGIGVSGIAWQAELMNLKYDSLDSINDAIRYAVDHGAKIINMSLGYNVKMKPGDYKRQSFQKNLRQTFKRARKAFQYAEENDVLMVIAAGNEADRWGGDLFYWDQVGNNDLFFAGWSSLGREFNNVIVAGSIAANGRMTSYSNYGKSVDIAAPGGSDEVVYKRDAVTGNIIDSETMSLKIYSTKPYYLGSYTGRKGKELRGVWVDRRSGDLVTSPPKDNVLLDLISLKDMSVLKQKVLAKDASLSGYQGMVGTSMATPVVSGSAALIWAENPELSAVEVKEILLDHAIENPLIEPFVNDGRQLNLASALAGVINHSS